VRRERKRSPNKREKRGTERGERKRNTDKKREIYKHL
jgi:hypothetical protein